MKILIIIFSSFFLIVSKNMQSNFLKPGRLYSIVKMKGEQPDLNMFFFLKKSGKLLDSSVFIKYDDNLKQISLLSGATLFAYFNVVETQDGLCINNYSFLREKLSFNDLRERAYKLEVKNKKENHLVLSVQNYGAINLLNKPIYFYLELKE